jgi:hypothetical protein
VATPVFVAAGVGAAVGSSAGALTGIGVPTGIQQADLLVLSVTWREGETAGPTAPGWQELGRSALYTRAGYGYKSAVFFRFASGPSEAPATVQLTTTEANLRIARIYAFRGVNPVEPFEGVLDAIGGFGGVTPIKHPDLTAKGAKRLGIALVHTGSDDAPSVFTDVAGTGRAWRLPTDAFFTTVNSGAGLQMQTIEMPAPGSVRGGGDAYDRPHYIWVAALVPKP